MALWGFGLWMQWGWGGPESLSADPVLAPEEARGRPCLPGPEAWKHRFDVWGPGTPGWRPLSKARADQNGQCRKGRQACRRNSVCASPMGPVQGGTADVTPGAVGDGGELRRHARGSPVWWALQGEGAGSPPLQPAGDPTAIRQVGRLLVSPRGAT